MKMNAGNPDNRRNHPLRNLLTAALLGLAIGAANSDHARAETDHVRVATQFGLGYLPLIVMEHDHLWEKMAEARGIKITADYRRLGGGGALNDALISDSVDMVAGGLAPLLVIWDRTTKSFKVKGVAALNASPMDILTNKPNVLSLKDLRPDDKIAVPSIRVSFQALALMAASERAFGKGQANRLDNQTVAMQHPDALAMLVAPNSQIAVYVSSSPFQERALKDKRVSKITDSFAAFGGPGTFSVVYAKEAFMASNPKVVEAFYAALQEAVDSIQKDRNGALDKYIAVTHDKTDRALLGEIMARPEFTFGMEPKGTLNVAELMHRVGLLKQEPKSWKDYFFEPLHGRHGG